MTGKKIIMAAALASGVILLSGCENLNLDFGRQEWIPQGPAAVSIKKDGSLQEIINETLDASYYSAAELQSMVTKEVSDYNGKHGADSIKIDSFEEGENGSIRLTMSYSSADDYSQFNNTEFYYGSMINAQLSGYLFDSSFYKVRNGAIKGDPVTGSDVIKEMDKQVLILRGPVEVQVPGELIYISTNAEVLAADVVNAIGGHEEPETVELILPSNDVYRSGGEEHSFDEEMAASRVYVIFDDTEG